MSKLIALKRFAQCTNIKNVYAERGDELELIMMHDENIGIYKNVKTSETFFANKKDVGTSLINKTNESKKITKMSGRFYINQKGEKIYY